jgi:hypothetical protein
MLRGLSMAVWQVEWTPKIDLDLSDCEVVTYREWLGNNVALVECDEAIAERIRSTAGVRLVQRPKAGEAFVDQSGKTIIVTGDGEGWKLHGE